MSIFHPRRILSIAALWVLCTGMFALFTGADAAQAASQARRWRVMVIVPEQHLDRRRIPDPAVETKVSEQLIDAGYKVIDQERIDQLRYSTVVDRIIRGGPNMKQEAIQLGRRFGADILITGEAFTQEVTREVVETDMGRVTQIQCRARVELKGIRMDSGEKFYAGSIQRTGPPEPTVELSSKACLESAAEAMGAGMLGKLRTLSASKGQRIELHVRNIGSISLANELEMALARIPGVLEVAPEEYDAQTYRMEIYVKKELVRSLAARLESTPQLKRFRLHVQSSSGSKIVVNRK